MSPEAAHEWRKTYIYYMSLREICFATALFCVVRDIDHKLVLLRAPGAAVPHLERFTSWQNRRGIPFGSGL
jgi:hypothetical protein